MRNARTNLARLVLGDKVADIGGFCDDAELYDPVGPWKARVAELKRQLDEQRLRRESLRIEQVVPADPGRPLGWLDAVAEDEAGWVVPGTARHPEAAGAAQEVLLANQHGRLLGYAPVREERQDVEAVFGDRRLRRSGWQAQIDRGTLEAGQTIVHALAYAAESRKAYCLQGEATLCTGWERTTGGFCDLGGMPSRRGGGRMACRGITPLFMPTRGCAA